MQQAQGRRRTVLAVDIGTSSLKGGIIDEEGALLEWAKVTFGAPSGDGYRHWDARLWLEAFSRLCGQLEGVRKTAALTVSGNGPSLVPLDAEGRPVAEALLWIDGRELRKGGTKSFFLPKAAWFAENRPAQYAESSFFLGCPEYLAYVLSGKKAAFTPSQEFVEYIWTREEIEDYGLNPSQFPEPMHTGSILGEVHEESAKRFGLRRGTAVIAGGADFLMALLGTGAVEPGITCDRTGTSEGINCCSAASVEHPRIRNLPHAIAGYYNAAGILSSTGLIFEWFRRLTGQQDRDYGDMLQEIRQVERSPTLPYFFPSLHRGAVWEFSGGAFTGLEAEHGAAEMGRAVVHSVGFGIRNLIETLEQKGCRIGSMRVSGGQGRNRVWNQMKADMTGKRIEIPAIIDAELTGGAIAAFSALDGAGLAETAGRLVRIEEVFFPDDNYADQYREEYEEYERICERMLPVIGRAI